MASVLALVAVALSENRISLMQPDGGCLKGSPYCKPPGKTTAAAAAYNRGLPIAVVAYRAAACFSRLVQELPWNVPAVLGEFSEHGLV